MASHRILISCLCVMLPAACGGDDPGDSGLDASSAASSASGSTTASAACGEVPTDAAALNDWLSATPYSGWAAESARHSSLGPHFGDVRVFVNDCMAESLAAQSTNHPVGSVAVKELYGAGDEVGGYSVMVKVDDVADGSWYWYERYRGTQYGDGVDDGECTGCHTLGVDSVRSLWPFG